MMRRLLSIFLVSLSTVLCSAEPFSTPFRYSPPEFRAAAVAMPPVKRDFSLEPKPLFSLNTMRSGVVLVGAGITFVAFDRQVRAMRNDFLPHFKYRYDDYLQFSPAVLMLGMKALGLPSRSSWERMVVSDSFALALTLGTIYCAKYAVGRMRPDNSSANSFPSGHTAMAFSAATMLHKEYGTTMSHWFSIAGYSLAAVTGISRSLNNRHWLSDIVVGAGIGILGTELGYRLVDKIFGDRGMILPTEESSDVKNDINPSFVGLSVGYNLVPYDRSEYVTVAGQGISVAAEGVWFPTRMAGIGAQIKAGRYPNIVGKSAVGSLKVASAAPLHDLSITAGPYCSFTVAERWLLGGKALFGLAGSRAAASTFAAADGTTALTVEYDNRPHFTAIAGVNLRYLVTGHMGLRFFVDYNYRPFHQILRYADNSSFVAPTHRSHVNAGVAVDALLW